MLSTALEVFRSDQRFRTGMNVFVNRAFEAFDIPLHTHDAIEISYVMEGTGFQFINDEVVSVKRGDIFLLPVGTSHVYRPSSPEKARTLGVINCVFRLEAFAAVPHFPPMASELHQAIFSPHTLQRPYFHYYDKDSVFAELFHAILREYRQRPTCYEVVVQSLFIQIITMLHRSTLLPSAVEPHHDKITEANQFIKAHFHEDVTLKQVAEHVYLSISHLQRLLKLTNGVSFTSYIQHLRVQKCCELLKSTTMTVQQIAGAIGYQDMKFFHTLFRERTGMTPQEYRKYGESAS